MKRTIETAGVAAAVAAFLLAAPAMAAELPKATQAILAKLKADASTLAGVDKELAVPAAWIAGARKEGALKLVDTHSDIDFRKMTAPFAERYPFIKINYSRGSYQARTVQVMMGIKAGNYPSDIAMDFGGFYQVFHKDGMLADMRELPGFSNVPANARAADGTWIAHRRQFWCVAFNTNKIKKADLPKTWDGFLEDARWRNGTIGLGNRPQLWLLMLWNEFGESYGKTYMKRLFADVKPQLRKEGMNALVSLTIAGELPMAIPASEYRVERSQEKGAPVGYHCPEPVPATMAQMGILKGSPHGNAARLYVNWLLSREGQIAQYYASRSVPVHEALQRREFMPFADEILGKKIALRDAKALSLSRAVQKQWGAEWASASGFGPLKTIEVTLSAVKRRGAVVGFKAGGAAHEVTVSGRRTKITIGGNKARRSKLKSGMACAVSYRGNGDEAKAIACK